ETRRGYAHDSKLPRMAALLRRRSQYRRQSAHTFRQAIYSRWSHGAGIAACGWILSFAAARRKCRFLDSAHARGWTPAARFTFSECDRAPETRGLTRAGGVRDEYDRRTIGAAVSRHKPRRPNQAHAAQR